MPRRLLLVACLVFSGLAALVYQVIWTRLLGFAFGTTSEAIGAVLAVFFAGLALGNLVAAGGLARVRRPLRLYALLELGIGLFALLSLPLLQRLDALHAWIGVDHGPLAAGAIRLAAAAGVLLPPTVAMGATLPVVARGLVRHDASLGRWSAILYAANTLGAVLGAYLCGFWMIPALGLTRSVWTAGAVNLLVAASVLLGVRGREVRDPNAVRGEHAGAPLPNPRSAVPRTAFLAFFGLSGFVAIGYEIVWARVFGIVMEGTLYGFAAVLASYLLGVGLGSLAIASRVDRIRDLPRAFGLLHAAIAVAVTGGMLAVPYLPYASRRLGDWLLGADALHPLFLLVIPIVLLPTALFGAAFPVLIRIYTQRARSAAQGIGLATGINTAGSIVASLAVAFWAIPELGTDATLFGLVLLQLAVALAVLLRFQRAHGARRLAGSGVAAAGLLLVCLGYDGVHVEQAVAGREIEAPSLRGYRASLEQLTDSLVLLREGRSSVVSVYDTPPARLLRTNGMPEAGVHYAPPYYASESILLGVLPHLLAGGTQRALVVGLGGGNTLHALLHTDARQVDVVELEREVLEAVRYLHAGRANPLDDPRVHLRVNDGRNELLLGRHRGGPRYDLIASQPSHPWVQGAANLFTEEFFALARDNLTESGVFALWVNGFRTDAEAVLAIVTSFARVFPQGWVVSGVRSPSRESLLLLGGRRPLHVDPAALERGLADARLGPLLALFELRSLEDLLALFEGPAAAFARIEPGAANTDDNAFVETRIPRQRGWGRLDFARVETRLPADAPVLPPGAEAVDVARVARSLLEAGGPDARNSFAPKLERLLRVHGAGLDAVVRQTLVAEARLQDSARAEAARSELAALVARYPDRPEPRRVLAYDAATRKQDWARAAAGFAEAFERSGDAQDAYDAGRALHPLDPSGAWRWLARIPAAERSRFPRLAFYEAERALAENRAESELRRRYDALLDFRAREEGRRLPGVEALLARLAAALGDAQDALAFADADRRERERRAEPQLRRAQAALKDARPDTAAEALAEAERLVPGHPRLAELRARLALARRDPDGLAEALAELHRFAPSLAEAVGTENRLRADAGLSLLPDRPAESLARR